MVGNTTILFKDSTFLYTERGGLFQGQGKWRLLPNGKTLELIGSKNIKGGDLYLRQEINFKLKIRGKVKLIGDDCIFVLDR